MSRSSTMLVSSESGVGAGVSSRQIMGPLVGEFVFAGDSAVEAVGRCRFLHPLPPPPPAGASSTGEFVFAGELVCAGAACETVGPRPAGASSTRCRLQAICLPRGTWLGLATLAA
jgi:hypothetical protein